MSGITGSWQRIEVALRQRMAPEMPVLPPGAAPEIVSRVEAQIGIRLPEPVRQSYLVHDGSNGLWICDQGGS
jgi:cell wall assembly regulator SMI1